MDYSYIFIHGWGMDARVWNNISKYFPAENSYILELGFIGEEVNIDIPLDMPAIYITHSLGAAYALKYHAQNMDVLISINGFSCFQNFVDERILQTMKKRLIRNPIGQMKSFWNNCGLDINAQNDLDGQLNIDRLQIGLEWLINWDMSDDIASLSVPILSLGGREDLILPIDNFKTQWSGHNLKIKDNGDHILPLSHPKWCMQEIKEFIGGLKLER